MINIIQTFLIKKVWQTLHWFFYWTIYYTFLVRNKPSPKARVPRSNVQIIPSGNGTQSLVVENLKKRVYVTDVAPSRSMDSWIDQGDKVILQESDGSDAVVGDVIVYAKNNNNSDLIIHQIVAESTDSEGKYFVCKGVNNPLPDRIRVRPSWIREVMLGVLY